MDQKKRQQALETRAHKSATALKFNNAMDENVEQKHALLFEYSFQLSMISGARYQRVATYSVIKPWCDSSGLAPRASPKSQILRSQLPFRSKLLGFCRGRENRKTKTTIKNAFRAVWMYQTKLKRALNRVNVRTKSRWSTCAE
jgi:hypothetical protein